MIVESVTLLLFRIFEHFLDLGPMRFSRRRVALSVNNSMNNFWVMRPLAYRAPHVRLSLRKKNGAHPLP